MSFIINPYVFTSGGTGGGDENEGFSYWLDGLPFYAPTPADDSEFAVWADGLPFNGED